MSCCEEYHKAFDTLANREIQLGELPSFLPVRGRLAWYVYRGPYRDLSGAWDLFWRKFTTKDVKMEGVPGDVYVCNPGCHKEDRQENMLTILYAQVA
ncbi:MAG TPA: hypothetical protein VIB49_10725 [Thermoplasmata archaeon]|jgi:hypothetical protein